MPFDPQHPLNLDGQLQAGRLLEMAEQAAQAGGSMTANGHYVQTPQGLLFCPDVPVEASGSVDPGDPFQIYATGGPALGVEPVWRGGVVSYSGTTSITIGEAQHLSLVTIDATVGDVFVFIAIDPGQAQIAGYQVTIRKADDTAHTITIRPNNFGDQMDGQSTITITDQYGFATLMALGTTEALPGGKNTKMAILASRGLA